MDLDTDETHKMHNLYIESPSESLKKILSNYIKNIYKNDFNIQGVSEQRFILKMTYSWHNSKTIFPLLKFYPKFLNNKRK